MKLDSQVDRIKSKFKSFFKNYQYLDQVLEKFDEREKKGFKKYGTNTDRLDLIIYDWLEHLQDELMDVCVYTERLMRHEGLLFPSSNLYYLEDLAMKFILKLETLKENEKTRGNKPIS